MIHKVYWNMAAQKLQDSYVHAGDLMGADAHSHACFMEAKCFGTYWNMYF